MRSRVAGQTILATELGPVQVAVRGEGVPVVVLHGTPGGVDAAAAMSDFLPADRFRSIMWSRPGYLSTPLSAGRTIDHQAHLAAAVLTALHVPAAAVLSVSGGGPAGYRLAVLHPERVTAVVAVSPVAQRYVEPSAQPVEWALMNTMFGDAVLRWMARARPAEFVFNVLASQLEPGMRPSRAEIQRVVHDPEQMGFLRALVPTAIAAGRRRPGSRNDLRQFRAIDSLELDRVSAPTLILGGDHESGQLTRHAAFAHEHIPGSERIVLPDGGHLSFYVHPDAHTAQDRAINFLSTHARS